MELDLAGLGLTIAAGAAATLALWWVVTRCADGVPFVPKKLPMATSKELTLLGSALALAGIFGLGMFVENLSKSLVGNPPPVGARWPFLFWVLPSDTDLRASVVIKQHKTDEWTSTRTGKRLGSERLFARSLGAEGAELDQALQASRPGAEYARRAVELERVFYVAKNHLYQVDNYYSELRAIEQRIAFARSCSAVAIVILAGGSLFILVVRLIRKKKSHLSRDFFLTLGVGLSLWWACRIVYVTEQFNYNVRVFGYWSTVLTPEYRGDVLRKQP